MFCVSCGACIGVWIEVPFTALLFSPHVDQDDVAMTCLGMKEKLHSFPQKCSLETPGGAVGGSVGCQGGTSIGLLPYLARVFGFLVLILC